MSNFESKRCPKCRKFFDEDYARAYDNSSFVCICRQDEERRHKEIIEALKSPAKDNVDYKKLFLDLVASLKTCEKCREKGCLNEH